MASDLTLFWILWSFTLLIISYTVFESLKKEQNVYGAPLLYGLMFSYFYVFQVFVVANFMGYLLEPWMLEIGQAITITCFSAFLIGWKIGLKNNTIKIKTNDINLNFNYKKMWLLGVSAAIISIVSIHIIDFTDDSYDYENTSAYLYMLYNIGYPGILATIIVIVNDKNHQSFWHKITVFSLAIGLTYIFFITARRGPVFPIVIVLLYGFGLMQVKKPKRILLITSISLIGLAMLAFPFVRNYSEGGMNAWNQEQVQALSINSITVGKSKQEGDNEALYHFGTVATAIELGNYQYGTGYLSLLTHWIPRSLWQDKPNLGQGWFPWTPSLMRQVLGWELSSGAAAGGVAETFMELGFFAPIVWLGLGFVMGRKFIRMNSKLERAQFITILASSHWLVSQGVSAAFVPCLIFYITITFIIKISSRNKKS